MPFLTRSSVTASTTSTAQSTRLVHASSSGMPTGKRPGIGRLPSPSSRAEPILDDARRDDRLVLRIDPHGRGYVGDRRAVVGRRKQRPDPAHLFGGEWARADTRTGSSPKMLSGQFRFVVEGPHRQAEPLELQIVGLVAATRAGPDSDQVMEDQGQRIVVDDHFGRRAVGDHPMFAVAQARVGRDPVEEEYQRCVLRIRIVERADEDLALCPASLQPRREAPERR